MVEAAVLLVFVTMLGALYSVWRAWNLLTRWRSAAAFVWSSDYTDAQVADDACAFGLLRECTWGDDGDTRSVEDLVQFDDADGVTRRARISRVVTRGRSPDGAYVVWYDPADPSHATAFGPGGWVLAAVLLVAGAAVLVQMATATLR